MLAFPHYSATSTPAKGLGLACSISLLTKSIRHVAVVHTLPHKTTFGTVDLCKPRAIFTAEHWKHRSARIAMLSSCQPGSSRVRILPYRYRLSMNQTLGNLLLCLVSHHSVWAQTKEEKGRSSYRHYR